MSDAPDARPSFSLVGGPLHRVAARLRLVHRGTDSVRLGLILGVISWAVLVLLALIDHDYRELLSLSVLVVHVRLLIAIPLLFLSEALLEPRMSAFFRAIERWDLVPPRSQAAIDACCVRTTQRTKAWAPEVVCLLLVVLWSLLWPRAQLPLAPQLHAASLAGWWYWTVCTPLFHFLLLRWLWRLVLWWRALLSVAKLDLHLVPAHPDGAGGIGYLNEVHAQFVPVVVAISATEAAAVADELAAGTLSVESLYLAVMFTLAVDAVLFVAPLLLFSPALWAARAKGIHDYFGLAARYVAAFEDKWLTTPSSSSEPLLGTPDLQSLADLNSSVEVVRGMRMFVATPRLLMLLAIAAVAPMLPLVLFRYRVSELAERFFHRLSGL